MTILSQDTIKMYKALKFDTLSTMMSFEEFDNGAIFTDQVDIPSFKGKWFSNKDAIMSYDPKSSALIAFASDEIKNDKIFMLSMIKLNSTVLNFLGDKLTNDKDIFMETLLTGNRYGTGTELADDCDLALEIYQKRTTQTYALSRFSKNVRNNKELLLKIVALCPIAFLYASSRLKNDKEVVEAIIGAFERLIDSGTDIRDINMKLCEIWWSFSSSIKQNTDIIVRIIFAINESFAFAFAILNQEVRHSRELTCLAIEHCYAPNFCIIDAKLRNDPMVLFALYSKLNNKITCEITSPLNILGYSINDTLVCLRLA